jgi:hypothetical protein
MLKKILNKNKKKIEKKKTKQEMEIHHPPPHKGRRWRVAPPLHTLAGLKIHPQCPFYEVGVGGATLICLPLRRMRGGGEVNLQAFFIRCLSFFLNFLGILAYVAG